MKNSWLLFALIAVSMYSCTIEKRHYRTGYHIDWHLRQNKAPGDHQASNTSESRSTVSESTPAGPNTVIAKPDLKSEPDPEPITTLTASEQNSVAEVIAEPRRQVPLAPALSDPVAVEHPKSEPSFYAGLGAFGVLILRILVSSVFEEFANTDSFSSISTLLIILSIVSAIFAIVWGNMAVRDMKRSPGTYSGEGKARAGRFLGWAYLVVMLLVFILTVILIFLLFSIFD